MSIDFSSVWAKLHRAEDHINTFEEEVMAWVNTNPYRVILNHNVDFSRYWATVRINREPSLQRWSLIAGDVVHNLRCSLDHLIYAIAIFRTQMNPPPSKRRWFFPIRDDLTSFQSTITDDSFSKLGTTVLEKIERFQPYNRPHERLPPLLGILRKFDDADKHRLLHVTMVYPGASGWDWNQNPSFPLPRMVPKVSEVVDGTKISELIFQRPSKNADPKLTADLVLGVSYPFSGEKPVELADMLPELAREVRTAIESVSRSV